MMLELVHDRVTTGVNRAVRKSAILRCGKKDGKSTFLNFLDILFPKTENKARCFLWRKSNPVVNYSPIQICRADTTQKVSQKERRQRKQKYVTASRSECAMEGL
jgi:hypothetical protein